MSSRSLTQVSKGANRRILITLFWWQKLRANLGFLITSGDGGVVKYDGGIHIVLYIRSKGLHISTTYAYIFKTQCLVRIIMKSIIIAFV